METYKISEFARLAGVTPRTLQYYDRQGILRASARTDKGYRLYTRKDLFRMQQIRTLKWMGFSLKEAVRVLDDNSIDLEVLLTQQKYAFEKKSKELIEAIKALDRMITIVQNGDEDFDAPSIHSVLNVLAREHSREWLKGYFDVEEWERFGDQANAVKDHAPAYYDIFNALQDAYSKNESPESAHVQSLVEQMSRLASAMKNKVHITDSVRSSFINAHQDREEMPPFMKLDEGFSAFFGSAMKYYVSQNGEK